MGHHDSMGMKLIIRCCMDTEVSPTEVRTIIDAFEHKARGELKRSAMIITHRPVYPSKCCCLFVELRIKVLFVTAGTGTEVCNFVITFLLL